MVPQTTPSEIRPKSSNQTVHQRTNRRPLPYKPGFQKTQRYNLRFYRRFVRLAHPYPKRSSTLRQRICSVPVAGFSRSHPALQHCRCRQNTALRSLLAPSTILSNTMSCLNKWVFAFSIWHYSRSDSRFERAYRCMKRSCVFCTD